MSFLALCFHNVMRRKLRSLLTAVAVAIAVAAVVSLVGVSTGFKRDFIEFYESVGIDILVIGKGKLLNRPLDESLTPQIKAVDGVASVVPGLTDQTAFPEQDILFVPLNGLEPGTAIFDHMKVPEGRELKAGDYKQVMLGVQIAKMLGKEVGDTIEIDLEEFEVVGLLDSANVIEKGQIIMPIKALQDIMGREGEVSGFSVIAKSGTTASGLERILRDIEAIDPAKIDAQLATEAVENQPGVKMAIGMAWVTSAIAMVIGTLGMLNTMLMSLQERIGEIGLLRAVGWRKSRIARMILSESVLLSLLGGVFGVLAAFGLVELLKAWPSAQGFISGKISLEVVLQSLAVAVGVGIIGGLLPAYNATRLAPAEALRQ